MLHQTGSPWFCRNMLIHSVYMTLFILPSANLGIRCPKPSLNREVHKTICYLLTVTSSILSVYLCAYNMTPLED